MKIDIQRTQTLVLPILSIDKSSVSFPYNEMKFDLSNEYDTILEAIKKVDNYVFIAFNKDSHLISYEKKDFHEIGLIARLTKCSEATVSSDDSRLTEDHKYQVVFENLARAKIYEIGVKDGIYVVKAVSLPDTFDTHVINIENVHQVNAELLQEVHALNPKLFANPSEVKNLITKRVPSNFLPEVSVFVNEVAIHLKMSNAQKIDYLFLSNIEERLTYLSRRINELKLGDSFEVADIDGKISEQIKHLGMPVETEKLVLTELSRLTELKSDSSEFNKLKTYIKWLTDLPWNKESLDKNDLDFARKTLDAEHYGLEDIKNRILEFIAVRIMSKKNPPTMICLVGSPGVGKTTLAKSIATALGKSFVKLSLGGVREEADIRGFQRTYIGSAPGRIIQGMKQAKTINPVFLLDEIDKMESGHRGDPAAALLEVLDPAQNKNFRDHYLEVEYDLSKVMFIATANVLEDIPIPLRDRMEVIHLSSYTELEKFEIAKNHLIQKQVEAHGLDTTQIAFDDHAIKDIIGHYTKEAGVRELDRNIATICRKSVIAFLDNNENQTISKEKLLEFLGKHKFEHNMADKASRVGFACGLAYTSVGGDILPIEVSYFKGKGEIILTGKLGDVMKESAELAVSYVKSRAKDFEIDETLFEKNDIHIHVPDGATPKDGPSAGITMTTALVSALTNRKIRPDVGMTGEITLHGRVQGVGGLKEKSISAHRSGLKTVIVPKDNEKDIDDIPQLVQDSLQIVTVTNLDEVLEVAYE